jgi:hypothetical protein
MNEPVFKGMKKGYAAVFVSDHDRNVDKQNTDRIRIFHSQDLKSKDIYMANTDEPMNIVYNSDSGIIVKETKETKSDRPNVYQPCWLLNKTHSIDEQIDSMKNYDLTCGRTTHFLGYVKDVE